MKKYLLCVKKYNNPFHIGEYETMKAVVVDKVQLQKEIDRMNEFISDDVKMKLEIKNISEKDGYVKIKGVRHE
mgnify:FL=1|jgi:hypothetical protein